jgi:hypothetical protein
MKQSWIRPKEDHKRTTYLHFEALGICAFLQKFHNEIQQSQISWTLSCDNQVATHSMNYKQNHQVNFEWKDSDVLLAIKQYIPERGKIQHVKGHQMITKDSSIPARLNFVAYKLANEAIHEPSKKPLCMVQFKYEVMDKHFSK